MITGRTQTGRRVWNISKLFHFMEMRLHKKNLHCKNCEAHLPTFHIEMPYNWKRFLSQKLSINSDSWPNGIFSFFMECMRNCSFVPPDHRGTITKFPVSGNCRYKIIRIFKVYFKLKRNVCRECILMIGRKLRPRRTFDHQVQMNIIWKEKKGFMN